MNNLQKALNAIETPITIKKIEEGDEVTFTLKEQTELHYTVKTNHLDLEIGEGPNDEIFNQLGITDEEKDDLKTRMYGYDIGGLWPEFKNYTDGTRLLMKVITLAKAQNWTVKINGKKV
jgi:hypothetical protein